MNKLKKLTVQYTQVQNAFLADPNLTMKAKLLYIYINSKPENWDFSVERIASQMKEGEKAVRNALKELKSAGLVSTQPAYNENNQVSGQEYTLHEYTPIKHTPKRYTPKGGTQSNNIYRKKDIEKKKEGGEPKQQPSLPEKIQLILNQYPELTGHPAMRSINDVVDDRPIEFVKWVLKNKTNVETLSKPIAWSKWFWEDYNTFLLREKKLDEELEWSPKYQAGLDRIMAGFDNSDPSKLPKDHPDYWDDQLQARLDRIMAGG